MFTMSRVTFRTISSVYLLHSSKIRSLASRSFLINLSRIMRDIIYLSFNTYRQGSLFLSFFFFLFSSLFSLQSTTARDRVCASLPLSRTFFPSFTHTFSLSSHYWHMFLLLYSFLLPFNRQVPIRIAYTQYTYIGNAKARIVYPSFPFNPCSIVAY